MTIRTWNGGSLTTNNWTDAANWGGTAPVAGDALVFDGSTRPSPVNDFPANTVFLSITFAATAGAFSLSGADFNLSGGAAAISDLSTTNTMTIANNIVFATSAPTINTATSGTLTISGTINNGGLLLTTTGGGLLTISGNISGIGGVYINCGLGFLNVFSGASNAFSGAVNIFSGGLKITNSNGLGTGTKNITINNGTLGEDNLRLDGSGGAITLPATLSFITSCVGATYGCIYNIAGNNVINGTFSMGTGGGGTMFMVAGGTLTLNGNVSATLATREMVFSGSGNGTFNGVLDNTNVPSMRKEGTGAWTVTGCNLFAGTTTINGGTLYANGKALGVSAVTVNASGTLRIAGTAGTDGGRGLIGRYYSGISAQTSGPNADFATLAALNAKTGQYAPSLVAACATMNKTDTGTGFDGSYAASAQFFYYVAKAKLVVPTTGVYTFLTRSDDGSCLWIGSTQVVTNNNYQGLTNVTGTITLTAGVVYDLTVGYFQGNGGYGLNAQISGAGNTTYTDLAGISTLFYLRSMDLVIASLAGSGSVIMDSGILIVGDTTTTTFSGIISTSSALGIEKQGTGTLKLTGTNSYNGNTIIDNGTLSIGDGTTDGSILNSPTIYVGNIGGVTTTPVLTYNIVGNQSFAGPIIGNGSITKSGGGTLTLTASNALTITTATRYTGGTTITAGSIITCGRALGFGLVTVNSGAFLIAGNVAGVASEYSSSNPGSGNMASLDLFLAFMATATWVEGNTAATLNMNTTGTGFPTPYNTGGSSVPIFSAMYACRFTVGVTGTYTFNAGSDDGVMVWVNGAVVVSFPGNRSFAYTTGAVALTAGVTYDLVIAYYNNTVGNAGLIVQISGANNTTYVDFNTSNANTVLTPDLLIGGLAGAGSVQLTSGGNLWFGDASNQTFTGVISGTGGIRKRGSGTQILTNTQSYTGTTEVDSGTLIINGSTVSGSPVTVRKAGMVGGNGTINGTLTVNSGGDVIPGAATGVSIATLNTGVVTLAAGSVYAPDLNGTTPTFDKLNSTGGMTITGSLLNIASIAVSTTGKVYTILADTVGITGTFAGKANGSTFTCGSRKFLITYNAATVTLTDQGPGGTSRFLEFCQK